MTTVVPRPTREHRSPYMSGGYQEAAASPYSSASPPLPGPYGSALTLMPPLEPGMPPPMGRRQLATYRPMAEELKKYIDALAGPTERCMGAWAHETALNT